ncbi:sugar O-acetyltransferase [Ligilactobacillus pobuzihii]|uniref:sugar O-acetyltransferase n=1 Tax=Ligilactobacillus pobuzihii TaxID=449659 RepID=UPI0019D2B9C3|nr:sugar O-acetyltransferase [Ligilactobacillus pobuzihii]MBN7274797.1 sugar O-acetyltransferase [Ligilactobacillus pobuzihii]
MKNEREIMLSAKLYDPTDKKLIALRKECKRRVSLYNSVAHEEEEQVQNLLAEMLGTVGAGSYIEPDVYIDYGKNVYVGEAFYGNTGLTMLDTCEIHIGDHVMIGPRVSLITAGHPIDASVRMRGLEFGKPITIGNNVWIGANVFIGPGVTIGDNAVIGGGAVVVKDVPGSTVAVGNPAKVMRYITPEDKSYWEQKEQEYYGNRKK